MTLEDFNNKIIQYERSKRYENQLAWFSSPFKVNITTYKNFSKSLRELLKNSDNTEHVLTQIARGRKENLPEFFIEFQNTNLMWEFLHTKSEVIIKMVKRQDVKNLISEAITNKEQFIILNKFLENRLKELKSFIEIKQVVTDEERIKKEQELIKVKLAGLGLEVKEMIDAISQNLWKKKYEESFAYYNDLMKNLKIGNISKKFMQTMRSLGLLDANYNEVQLLEERIKYLSIKEADSVKDYFVTKIVMKLTGLDIKLYNLTYLINTHYSYSISFTDINDNKIIINSHVIVNRSVLGNEFYQFPFTFKLNGKQISELELLTKLKYN